MKAADTIELGFEPLSDSALTPETPNSIASGIAPGLMDPTVENDEPSLPFVNADPNFPNDGFRFIDTIPFPTRRRADEYSISKRCIKNRP